MGTTLKFFINKRRMNEQTRRSPIYLRIIHNLKKAEGKTNLTPINESEANDWIKESQRFSSKEKKFITYNLLLNELQNEFHNYLRDHNTQMASKTPHEIRDHLLSRVKEEHKLTILDAVNQFYLNDILQDVDKALGTKKNYKRAINHFSNFLKHTKFEHLCVNEFKRQHASKFIDYLKKPNKKYDKIALNGQSVHSVVKNIKPFFIKLHFEEEITLNPFLGIKTTFKRTEKPRLTNENFKSIIELYLSDNIKLDIYRDLFIFLCYTGLSYCDTIDLKYIDIENDYFNIQRKKSKVQTKQFLTKQIP
jgi:hypothetical protein